MEISPDNFDYLHTKGWGLYKQGKYKEALEFLEKSWDVKSTYDHEIYLHLEAVKKAVANQKNDCIIINKLHQPYTLEAHTNRPPQASVKSSLSPNTC